MHFALYARDLVHQISKMSMLHSPTQIGALYARWIQGDLRNATHGDDVDARSQRKCCRESKSTIKAIHSRRLSSFSNASQVSCRLRWLAVKAAEASTAQVPPRMIPASLHRGQLYVLQYCFAQQGRCAQTGQRRRDPRRAAALECVSANYASARHPRVRPIRRASGLTARRMPIGDLLSRS